MCKCEVCGEKLDDGNICMGCWKANFEEPKSEAPVYPIEAAITVKQLEQTHLGLAVPWEDDPTLSNYGKCLLCGRVLFSTLWCRCIGSKLIPPWNGCD